MASYTVHMINFNLDKGTFSNVQDAINHARALGFECSIVLNEPGKTPLHLCTVKPF